MSESLINKCSYNQLRVKHDALILLWQCLFCLMRQKLCCGYFALSWTLLVEVVTWQVQNTWPA